MLVGIVGVFSEYATRKQATTSNPKLLQLQALSPEQRRTATLSPASPKARKHLGLRAMTIEEPLHNANAAAL